MEPSSLQINLAKLSDANHWTRIVLMIAFVVVLRFVLWAIELIAIAQVLASLLTAKPHLGLKAWSKGLSSYVHQITEFLTYQTEAHPFPFSKWPN